MRLPRFHTGRVINVLAELIFYCQVTWSFYSPYTCIGVEVEHLTTVFLLRFQKLVKFAQNPAFLFVYILLRGMQQGSTFGFCFILEIDHSDQFSLIIG